MNEPKITEAEVLEGAPANTNTPETAPKKPEEGVKDKLTPTWAMVFFSVGIVLAIFNANTAAYLAFIAGFIVLLFLRSKEFTITVKEMGKEIIIGVKVAAKSLINTASFTKNLVMGFFHKAE